MPARSSRPSAEWVQATAIASAAGQAASDDDPDTDGPGATDRGGVDGVIQGERAQADQQAAASGSAGSGTAQTPSAQTSSGPITVAAAVAVNLATTKSMASIPVGVTVTAGGKITIATSANTDAAATGSGGPADAVDVGEGDVEALLVGDIDSDDTWHVWRLLY